MASCYRHPDRETGVSCSECGRPICYECMTAAPVGLRCPDHAGAGATAPTRRRTPSVSVPTTIPRVYFAPDDPIVTKGLIGLNVLVFLVNLAQGASLGENGGSLFYRGLLFGPAVADGDWYRLITSAFLHGNLLHIAINMLMLWWIGAPVERAIGHSRFLAVYLVSALAGAAGALLLSPDALTVGASGAIFGILGAALVFERQRHYVLGGSALSIIVLNLILTFAFAAQNISIGTHIGGLIGGAAAGLALSRLGRGHPIYGRPGAAGVVGIAAVAVVSVAVAYLRVQSLA